MSEREIMKPSERIKQLRVKAAEKLGLPDSTNVVRIDAIELFLDEAFVFPAEHTSAASPSPVVRPSGSDPSEPPFDGGDEHCDLELRTPLQYLLSPDEAQVEIARVCDEIKEMLLAKNLSYGNSADVGGVFSSLTSIERLAVRRVIELLRIRRGTKFGKDDAILELIGYLVLLRIARECTRQTSLQKTARGSPFHAPLWWNEQALKK
jgi:hypothetical protein